MDDQSDNSAGLGAILSALRRRWWAFGLCLLLVPVAAYTIANRQPDKYRATAALLFDDQAQFSQILGSSGLATSATDRDVTTHAQLVQLPPVADAAAQRLGGVLTGQQIADRVSVSGSKETNLVTITVEDTAPGRAANIANAYGKSYIDSARASAKSRLGRARRVVNAQLAGLTPNQRAGDTGVTLRRSSQDLATLAALENGGARFVASARAPISAFAPTPKRTAVLGLLLGAVLGFAVALLIDSLDRRLRNRDEIEALFGRPVLATVPRSRSFWRAGARLQMTGGEPEEAMRSLRANLRYLRSEGPVRSVLLTSPVPGDGATTLAAQLASAAAIAGQRVLLVEANLRRPSLGATLRLPADRDLVAAAAGLLPAADCVHSVAVTRRGEQVSAGVVDVLAPGHRPPNPQELLESPTALRLIEELGAKYDLMVIDASPIALVPDALPLLEHVDGIIIVARAKRTLRPAALRLKERIGAAHGAVLGVVITGVRDELSTEIRRESRRSRKVRPQRGAPASPVPAEAAQPAHGPSEPEHVVSGSERL